MREPEATTLGAGYQGKTNLILSYQQETVDTLACLATATSTHGKAVENLTETVNTSTTQLVTTNEKLFGALSKITRRRLSHNSVVINPTNISIIIKPTTAGPVETSALITVAIARPKNQRIQTQHITATRREDALQITMREINVVQGLI